MGFRFTVLASGSSGNAALLDDGTRGVLIDCGLHPRAIGERLAAVGAGWPVVSAVILTHTHGDHWNRLSLLHLHRMRVPVHLHQRHADHLANTTAEFPSLVHAGLVRPYDAGRPVELIAGVTALPIPVPHDSDPTFAFRFDGTTADGSWSVGHLSDLGHVPDGVPELFAGVDVLAIESNHDEEMERRSGRPWHLIQRVLGKHGHLSNRQAAEFTRGVLTGPRANPLRAVVQLHLSRHCNSAARAAHAGRWALEPDPSVLLQTATQDAPTTPIELVARPAAPLPRYAGRGCVQPALPGMS